MHQTFYIDLEEEISSVVDRLNKSMSVDNYFVIPKRAIFLQSIVNLKLLKREADKVGKHVVIVTQDEVGASMAERSGIDVRSALDGLESDAVMDDEAEDEEVVEYEAPKVAARVEQKKQVRLSGVGSSEYYDSSAASVETSSYRPKSITSESRTIPVNSISAIENEEQLPRRETPQPSMRKPVQLKISTEPKPRVVNGLGYRQKLDSEKEKTLEKMYAPRENNSNESPKPTVDTERKIKKIFIGFVGLCLLAFAGVAAYLFLPSAKIIIEPNITKSKMDLDLHGTSDVADVNQMNIPIRVIDKEESISLSYDVRGGATSAGKKAHGSVVIYNEYDSSPQTLIATTRLQSADGKIFRLVKNIVVPGTTTIAGEVKPGAIAADVIADQSGPDYNIDPTNFTISGFKDGPKFEKFYAKSTEKITGGSTDGETVGGVVSQGDIDGARQKTEVALKDKLAQVIEGELQGGEVALKQANKVTIIKSTASAKVGDMTSTFEYTATASAHGFIFSENDVKKSIEQSLNDDNQSQNVKKDVSKIEYGTINSDFDKNTLELKVHGEITSTPMIDNEQIKKELLGKPDDQLATILKKYTTIKSVNVEFQPKFISRIPQYSQRVSVEIQNKAN